MFLYFFDIFFATISAALPCCCFLFFGTFIISAVFTSSIAFLLFWLKLLIALSCCFLNSSKSKTLFAASSKLSPLNKSPWGSSSYWIVPRSSSFTRYVFFFFFFLGFCIFERSFSQPLKCFFFYFSLKPFSFFLDLF